MYGPLWLFLSPTDVLNSNRKSRILHNNNNAKYNTSPSGSYASSISGSRSSSDRPFLSSLGGDGSMSPRSSSIDQRPAFFAGNYLEMYQYWTIDSVPIINNDTQSSSFVRDLNCQVYIIYLFQSISRSSSLRNDPPIHFCVSLHIHLYYTYTFM